VICSIHAFDPMTAPATISLCPFRYFVQLWSTRSKPRSSGRKLTGVANVLSINETRPWDVAKSTMLSRSGTRISGLEIVST
jgi:hypothetical protein